MFWVGAAWRLGAGEGGPGRVLFGSDGWLGALGWPSPSGDPPRLDPTTVIGAGPRLPFGWVGVRALVRYVTL